MAEISNDKDANDEPVPPLPPIVEPTAQAIANVLHHQYGIDCVFFIIVMPKDDAEMLAQTAPGAMPERAPRCAVSQAGMGDDIAAQAMRNVLEAYGRKVTPDDPIGETKGNG